MKIKIFIKLYEQYNLMNAKQYKNTGVRIGIFFALTVMLALPVLSLPGSPIGVQKAHAANNWYMGIGAKPNTYYTYKVQNHDTKEGQPFIMTIYFKEFDKNKGYWIAPVYVVEPNGNVVNGTFHLSDLDLSALGSSQIPVAMRPYKSGYVDTLDWLASFVPKPGLSLTAPYWGKLAAIGGSPIAPNGAAKVTVPAGTFDTTAVAWHYGADNNLYVTPNMPYPVKAQAFAAVTSGSPPLQFAFELQSTGQGPPKIPKSQVAVVKPPLTLQTGRGTYNIQLFWEPVTIVHGKPTKFGVLFKDSTNNIVNQVSYTFAITTPDGKMIKQATDQKAPDGTGVQVVTIPQAGPFVVKVSVDAVEGSPSGEFIESVTYNLVAK
jgi:hypothetical protein